MKSLEKRSTRPPGRRRGQVMVLTAGSMVLVMGMVAFTVDIGYIAVVKTKLQATADAIVFAASVELPDKTKLDQIAKQYANLNYPDGGNILADADIEIGIWDGEKFTPTTNPSTANALRVTVRQSQANGNPLSLYFAPILGITSADVSASATVLVKLDFKCAFAGIRKTEIEGNGYVDSYRSTQGPYSKDTAGQMGNVCSDGLIEIKINAVVNGSASHGPNPPPPFVEGGGVEGTNQRKRIVDRLDSSAQPNTQLPTVGPGRCGHEQQ